MADVFTQARWGFKSRFEFDDPDLLFSFTEPSGSTEFRVRYESLAFDEASFVITKNYKVLMIGLVLFMPIMFVAMSADSTIALIGIVLGVVLAAMLLIWQVSEWFDVGITQIPNASAPGISVCILKDRQHDGLLCKLKSRKGGRVRAMLLPLNLAGDLDRERSKFDWLLAGGFIDADEHANATTRIAIALEPPHPSGRLN